MAQKEPSIVDIGVAADIRDIKEMLATSEKMHNKHTTDIEELRQAFPSADIEGHRRYHEAMIEKNAALRSLAIAIKEKTISGLIWSAIMGAGIAIWHAIINGLRASN